MSTTFGVIVKDGKLVDIETTDEDSAIDWILENTENLYVLDVAFRSSWGIEWKNNLAQFLPPETKVYPIDNSHQGIYTIGDIIKEINEY